MASTSCPHADVWRLAPARGRPAFRRFIRQGLPAHARKELWALWSGAADASELAESAHAYARLVAQGEGALRAEDVALLRADLPRTHAPADSPVCPDALERVLRAFVARRDLDVGGYTQGMNFLASFALSVLRSELLAFHALLHLSATVGLFGHDMAPLRAEVGTLRLLAAARWPRLDAKLLAIGLPLEAVATRWL